MRIVYETVSFQFDCLLYCYSNLNRILGLFRGSYQTFQVLNSKDEAKKREMLEYWVVLNALIFVLPWLDAFLGWFLFSGLIGLLKCGLLLLVVVSKQVFQTISKRKTQTTFFFVFHFAILYFLTCFVLFWFFFCCFDFFTIEELWFYL